MVKYEFQLLDLNIPELFRQNTGDFECSKGKKCCKKWKKKSRCKKCPKK